MSRGTLNKAIIIGRLGRDPEMKYTPSGTAVSTFSMATNYSVKGEDGNFVDKTEWHNIVVYGKRAEFAGEYLAKGRLVYVEGRIHTRSWEDQNGQKKYMTEIVGSDLQLLGSKGDSTEKTTAEEEKTEQTPAAGGGKTETGEEDDLPF